MDDAMREWRRGATLKFSIYTNSPDVDENTPVRAVGKKVRSATSQPPAQATDVDFTAAVTFIPAEGDTEARWLFKVSPAVSHELDLGVYLIDVAIDLGGDVEVTRHEAVNLVESVGGGFEDA